MTHTHHQKSPALKLILVVAIIFALTSSPTFAGSKTWYEVKWVNDGDTITLKDKTKVRLIGIDAPEVRHGERPGQPFGNKAKKFVINLIKDNKVRLELDQETHDHYGRVLAYVFLPDGRMVNAELVKAGMARVLDVKPNNKYAHKLLSLQRQAMAEKKGIWSLKNFDVEPCYIANTKTKKIHRPSCSFGKTISPKNRKCFATTWEAYKLGYAPCKKCQP